MPKSDQLQELYEDEVGLRHILDTGMEIVPENEVAISGEEFFRLGRLLQSIGVCKFHQKYEDFPQRIQWLYTNVLEVASGETDLLLRRPIDRKAFPRGCKDIRVFFTPEMINHVAYELQVKNPSKEQISGWLENLVLLYMEAADQWDSKNGEEK